MTPPAPQVVEARRRRPLAQVVRSIHLYLSLSASFAIAFFALSGLVAEIAGEASAVTGETVPVAILADTSACATHLQERFGLSEAPVLEPLGEDLLIGSVDLGDERLDLTVYLDTAVVEVLRWRSLPADLALDHASLERFFTARLGRAPVPEKIPPPDDAPALDLRFDSVWRTQTVTIDREDRRWGLRQTEHPLARTLTDLHTGRHASLAQRLLMDAVAVLLLLSVVSGLALGLVWLARNRRRLPIILTCLGGFLCLVLLLVGR